MIEQLKIIIKKYNRNMFFYKVFSVNKRGQFNYFDIIISRIYPFLLNLVKPFYFSLKNYLLWSWSCLKDFIVINSLKSLA